MIGLERGVLRLASYQAGWAAEFEAQAKRLRAAMGDRIGPVEHMGSTAIEGMEAKPIIDIMAAVASLDAAAARVADLEALGYEWRPRDRQDVPDRLYFVRLTPDGVLVTHHLSLAAQTSQFWQRQLLFRDYLRAHPEARAEYVQLKQELCSRRQSNRGAYPDAKADFIQRILKLARP